MNEQLNQLNGYLRGMWRYRWSALSIAWIVAFVGWLVVFSLPNQYSVKTVVYVDTSSALKPLLEGLAPETDSRDELMIMTRVLLSRNNLLSIIRETDMDLQANTTEEKEALLEGLTKAIEIKGGGGRKRDLKNNLYEISYQSSSAKRSYQVVSNLLNTMIEDTLNSTRTDTVSAQKFLDSQISVYEERLSLAEQNLAQFKKENVGYMPDERGSYYMRLQRATDSVEETKSALRLANLLHAELAKQLKQENPILSSADYQSENAKKIQAYQVQVDSLLNKYTDRHPKVLALRMIIKDLKASPDTTGDTSGGPTIKEFNPVYQEVKKEFNKSSIQIETLKTRLEQQNNYVKKLHESIDIIPEVEAKLSKLNRGYEVTRERYLNLVERSESAKLAQSADQNSSDINFRVIEPPIVPFIPSGPNRALLVGAVLLGALATGLGWGFLRYTIQPTFISLTQVAYATDIPILGTVNLHLSPEHRKRRRMQLSFFILGIFFLMFVFGVVFLLRDSGAALISSVIMGK